jgi:phthalate 4,5-cis-dihydrodiol dehydrogenase
MKKTLRLGLIGLGRAAGLMISTLAAHPHVRLVAAADPIPAARSRFEAEFGGRTFADADELCASEAIDAVYVATPHQLHAANVLSAAAHGKHAIVEKPMALSLDDCRAMTEAARRAGTVLVVGHTHAFDRPVQLIGEVVASGELGALRTIVNLAYTNFLYRPRRPEELDPRQGGGILYNQLPHQIEIVRTIATAPVRTVRAVAGSWDPARPVDGALAAFLTFADGAVAQLTYSGYDRFDSDELHYGIDESGVEKGTLVHGAMRAALRAAGPEAERRKRAESGYGLRGAVAHAGPMHEPHLGFLLVSCERADLRPAPDGVTVYGDDGPRHIPCPPPRVYPSKDGVIDEFYAAVVDGIPATHDGAWATATMELVFALAASAREQREVAA